MSETVTRGSVLSESPVLLIHFHVESVESARAGYHSGKVIIWAFLTICWGDDTADIEVLANKERITV
jgi:hypothetical protein